VKNTFESYTLHFYFYVHCMTIYKNLLKPIEINLFNNRYTTDVIMSTAFGIESNSLKDPDSQYRRWDKKVFEQKSIWVAMFLFMPQFLNLFSIPIIDRNVTHFFTKIFQDNVNYRQTFNVVRHDFMNILIQLMTKGYVDPDDEKDTNISCKFIMLIFILI